MGARGRGLPRLRRLPAQDRPGDPRRARGAEGLSGPRTAVVTGASDGIGAAAARRLHRDGWRVVVVGRSAEKTATVADELERQGHPDDHREVERHTVDFARLDDVRALAATLAEQHRRIDVLANNAGASFPRRTTTVDGFETTFQVDHLAGYLLTRLLEEPLRAARGRVVTTSSFMHRIGPLPRRVTADPPRPYSGMLAYSRAKTMNALFTRELARRWAPDVTATCYTPGAVATSFGARSGGLSGLAWKLGLSRSFRTPAQGADTLVWLATAAEGWRNGGFHADRDTAPAMPWATDDRRARDLWQLSADAVGLPA
ncbi:SDR family NAD(P)-dependent oxidoreductase [Klenkia sp. PcliD-1-E]|uniref:SDR family NAD(P)-dependent oxidoreductase n=1 Tax=Klenkia sp. PcliD-1-E TaxID=2954492 RepID=UPI0020984A76|nr:SDR family NAD(P)-dependent oxidoreductase [Klenkia sp. PcliD-1-E]MCO7221366.1 SDR family NAD(P)-dependent oxidoreductase [Klenkia sp. PcliD-1-E]